VVDLAKAYDNVNTAFDDLFTSIEKNKDALGPYTQILATLNDKTNVLRDSATQYGLSLDPIEQAYTTARARLVTDFNQNIQDAMKALADPFSETLRDENNAGHQRVRDAQQIGAEITDVQKLNAANLERIALDAADKLGIIAARADDFIGVLGDKLRGVFGSLETQVGEIFNSTAGVAQLAPASDAFSQAFNSIQQQRQAAIDAASLAYSDPALQQTVLNAIEGVTTAALARLGTDFNAQISQLTLTASNPVQDAINREYLAGQQRVVIAKAVGADLAQVEEYNQKQLERVAISARSAVAGIVTAADAIKTADAALSGAISSVSQQSSGPFKQALDNLNIAFGKLIAQIDQLSNSTADVTPVLQAYAKQIDNLRVSFNTQISQLTLAITDPVQAALNAELDAGKKRVADAMAIGADIAAVDEFNRLSLLKVFTSTQAAIQDTSSSLNDFTNSLDSLQGALAQLTSGNLSGLTPAQTVNAAVENFRKELTLVQGGAAGEIGNLSQAGTSAVQAAQAAYGNSPQTAKIREEIVKSLQGVALQTATQASLEASRTTVTATNVAQTQTTLRSEATAARRIADLLQTQADLEFRRTGVVNQSLQTQATAARNIANELASQTESVSIQADLAADAVGIQQSLNSTLETQYKDQATKLNAIADQLDAQAAIEYKRTGIANNVYQMEADGARQVAVLLNQQALAGSATVEQLQAQSAAAYQVAAQLSIQAQAEAQRTGVKNNLLQNEADLALQIAQQMGGQATSNSQTAQVEADRAKLSVAQIQQQADIGQRTVEAQARGAGAANDNADAQASGYDLALRQLDIQRQISSDATNVARAEIQAQIEIAAQVLAAQKAAADAFTAAVNIYSQAVAAAAAAAVVPTAPPAAAPIAAPVAAVPPSTAGVGEATYSAFLGTFIPPAHYGETPPYAYASGTGSTAPGWVMVGEQGPEWLYQRGGNTVLPSGVSPPAAANDDVLAEMQRQRDLLAALLKQLQGGQMQAAKDARNIASETAGVGRKITFTPPMRRVV
jgi:hypothetical protein